MKVCNVTGCERRHYARGYCNMHWQRARSGGNVGIANAKKSPDGCGRLVHGHRQICVNYVHKFEHVMIVEKVLGKPLTKGAIVHHIDNDPLNNMPSNLIVCPNQAYHMYIHLRTRAYEVSGHADWIKCKHCKEYDDPNNLYIRPSTNYGWHRSCEASYKRRKYHSKEIL